MKKIDKNKRLSIYILVVLIGLQFLFLGLQMFAWRGRNSSLKGNGSSKTSFFPFLWLIVMAPILVSRKKKFLSEKHRKWMMWALVGLATLVLLIMILVFLKARS